MSEDLVKLVSDKLHFISREQLFQIADENNLTFKRNSSKAKIAEAIIERLTPTMAEVIVRRNNEYLGYTASELEAYLNITGSERRRWTKSGLLKVSGYYYVNAYGGMNCPIYDAIQVVNLSQDIISQWRAAIRPLTEKQLAGYEKAKRTALERKTCTKCGMEVRYKKDLIGGLCEYCNDEKKAHEKRLFWLNHAEDYVIVDTETTGVEVGDQIIEIAIIDLEWNVLLNTLVMPTVKINDAAYAIHGITYEMLKGENAPSWKDIYPEVYKIIHNKTVIAYNSEFDQRMIENNCSIFGLKQIKAKYECLMQNVMLENSSERRIKLEEAAGSSQKHRALDDCYLCLEIIQRIPHLGFKL